MSLSNISSMEEPSKSHYKYIILNKGYNEIGDKGVKLLTQSSWNSLKSIGLSKQCEMKINATSPTKDYLIWQRHSG
jgi:hypothetical protein